MQNAKKNLRKTTHRELRVFLGTQRSLLYLPLQIFSQITTISVLPHFISSRADFLYRHLLTYFSQGSTSGGGNGGWQTEELLARRSFGTV